MWRFIATFPRPNVPNADDTRCSTVCSRPTLGHPGPQGPCLFGLLVVASYPQTEFVSCRSDSDIRAEILRAAQRKEACISTVNTCSTLAPSRPAPKGLQFLAWLSSPPSHVLPANWAEVLILHGTKDWKVPHSHGRPSDGAVLESRIVGWLKAVLVAIVFALHPPGWPWDRELSEIGNVPSLGCHMSYELLQPLRCVTSNRNLSENPSLSCLVSTPEDANLATCHPRLHSFPCGHNDIIQHRDLLPLLKAVFTKW